MDPRRDVNPDPRRALPSVDRLVREVGAARPDLPAWAITLAARRLVAEARERIEAAGESGSISRGEAASDAGSPEVEGSEGGNRDAGSDWGGRVAARAERLCIVRPRPLVNATGVVLHTNLGRAPLAPGAVEAAARAAAGYSDLELDLETGRRGDRLGGLADKLCLLADAEAAAVVNNNAAAVLLALDTLARGREVIVSRGELVEIGGSFRVPEIMARSGVKLVEVGTTNRTHARDYEQAIGPETALLLKVHRSNFELRGFVKEVALPELVAIGRAHGLPVLEDLGSGSLVDLTDRGFPRGAWAPASVRTGADVVCFSGDKLLGGPQAGIALGRREAIRAMRSNPMARALRLDKMTLAALDWTLGAVLEGRAESEVPALRQMLEPVDSIERRARALAERLEKAVRDAGPQVALRVERDRAPVGGGSLPGFELDTFVVSVRVPLGAERLAERLRRAPMPVLGRVRDDALLLDLRTIADDEQADLADSLRIALR